MIEAVLSFLSNYALIFILHVMGAGSFPKPRSSKQEAEHVTRIKHGDKEARASLIEHNLRLVAHIVKKYSAVSAEQDDLVSIGTIGLIKAIDTFDTDKNIKLSSYASRCIKKKKIMYFSAQKKKAIDVFIK